MAIIFEMWVECNDEQGVQCLARHFSELECTLLNGRTIKWIVEAQADCYGLVIWSKGLSRYGVRSLQDALETTEAGLRLYRHLKDAPEFRFAHVGWDAENFSLSSLPSHVKTDADGQKYLWMEGVVDDALFNELGSPRSWHSFRPGYWWRRYTGENYQPLYSNDQTELNDLCRKLLPEYFKY